MIRRWGSLPEDRIAQAVARTHVGTGAPITWPCRWWTRSWLGLGLELVEGLGGMGEGVGEGLVPVHVRAAGAQFPGALLAQGGRHDRADQLNRPHRPAHEGFGDALDDRGSLRPGGGQRARDDVEDD